MTPANGVNAPSGGGQYFEPSPASRSRPRRIDLVLPDVRLRLTTDSGVFSGHRVDPGTMVLLASGPQPPDHGDVLDLGAGYGPITLTLARRSPRAVIWAVDVNERALDLVRRNGRELGIANVVAALPADVPPDLRFAAVYSNPPVRIGKAAQQQLLETWLARLQTGGRAYLVVHKHLGSDSLARWLTERGFPTRRLCSRSGYRVLEVESRQGAPRAGARPVRS